MAEIASARRDRDRYKYGGGDMSPSPPSPTAGVFAYARGDLFFLRLLAALARFGAIGELVIVLGKLRHDRHRLGLLHAIGERAHFRGAVPPMRGIVDCVWLGHERTLVAQPQRRPGRLLANSKSGERMRQAAASGDGGRRPAK